MVSVSVYASRPRRTPTSVASSFSRASHSHCTSEATCLRRPRSSCPRSGLCQRRVLRAVQLRHHHATRHGQAREAAGCARTVTQHRHYAVEQRGAHGGIPLLQEALEGELEGRQQQSFFSLQLVGWRFTCFDSFTLSGFIGVGFIRLAVSLALVS